MDDDVLAPGEVCAQVVHLDGSVRMILGGELDLATAPQLWAASAEVIDRAPPGSVFVLDAHRLGFLDAAGLGVIVRLGNRLRRRGAKLRVEGTRPPVRRLFDLTELDHLVGEPTPASRVPAS